MSRHKRQHVTCVTYGLALLIIQEAGISIAIAQSQRQRLYRTGYQRQFHALTVGVTCIAGDIAYAWYGLSDLLMAPIYVEECQFHLQGMVEERCLGTHLVIPVVLRVIGALIILKESGIKATRLITSCHRDVEELFFGGQVFYRELRCQLRKVKLAIISILKITQCRSPGSSAIGLIVLLGMFVVETQTHTSFQSAYDS